MRRLTVLTVMLLVGLLIDNALTWTLIIAAGTLLLVIELRIQLDRRKQDRSQLGR